MAPAPTLPRGAFPVELDRTRTLFFDLAASKLLQDKYGILFPLVLEAKSNAEGQAVIDVDALQFALFAGLAHDGRIAGDPLSFEACAEYLTSWRIAEIRNLVRQALFGATYIPPEPKPLGNDAAPGSTPAPAAARKTPAKKRKASISLKPNGLHLHR